MASLLIQSDPALARKQKLAEAMMSQGMQTGPVSHWTEGLARILNAGAGAYYGNKFAQQERDQQKAKYENLAKAISGSGLPADGMGPPQPLLSRLASVEGVNPEFIAQMKLQQEMQPQERDPIADYQSKKIIDQKFGLKERDPLEIYRGKKLIDQEFPRPQSEFDNYLKTLQAEKLQADIEKNKLDVEQKLEAGEMEDQTVQTAVDQISRFVQMPGFNNIYGPVAGVVPNFMPESVDAESLRKNIVSVLALAARKQLKGTGTISDREQQTLREAQTTLENPRITPQEAKKEAGRVVSILRNYGAQVPDEIMKILSGNAQPHKGRAVQTNSPEQLKDENYYKGLEVKHEIK